MKSRLLCLTLAILMLVSAFISCTGDEAPETSEQIEETTELVDPAVLLDIIVNGASKYTMIRPDRLDTKSDVVQAAMELRAAIKEATGVEMKLVQDWVKRGDPIPEYEIIIGQCERDEVTEILPEIAGSRFAVRIVGKKLVIAGGTDAATVDAVYHFIDNVLPLAASENSLIMSSEYDFHYDCETRIKSLNILGAPVADYTIVIPKVYSASEYRTAVLLRNHLAENCGYIGAVTKDDAPETAHEILIGNTNRSGGDQPTGQNYCVMTSGSKLLIRGASMYAYQELQKYLSTDLFAPRKKEISIDEGFKHTLDVSSTLKEGAENVLARSGEIRIMFNNIYGNCNTTLHPRVQRQQQQIEMFMQYLPDVLCMQEFNSASRVGTYALDKMLRENGYVEVQSAIMSKNYTPVFYRSDVLDLIDSGWHLYSDGMGDASKSLTWAVFETKNGGNRFAAISTHYCYKSANDGGNIARVADANQLLDIVRSISKKYPGTPIFAGGDLNCNISSEPLNLMKTAGMIDVAVTAEKREDIRSSHSYPTFNTSLEIYDNGVFPTGTHANSIDHIFLYDGGSLELKLYDVVTDLFSLLSSDHCPVYADFNFKK